MLRLDNLVISGNEETVTARLTGLLGSGLNELMEPLVPVTGANDGTHDSCIDRPIIKLRFAIYGPNIPEADNASLTSFIMASTNWSAGSGSCSSVVLSHHRLVHVIGPLLTSLESVESVDSTSVASSVFSLGVIPCGLSLPAPVSCELSVATLLLSDFSGAGVICAKTEFRLSAVTLDMIVHISRSPDNIPYLIY